MRVRQVKLVRTVGFRRRYRCCGGGGGGASVDGGGQGREESGSSEVSIERDVGLGEGREGANERGPFRPGRLSNGTDGDKENGYGREREGRGRIHPVKEEREEGGGKEGREGVMVEGQARCSSSALLSSGLKLGVKMFELVFYLKNDSHFHPSKFNIPSFFLRLFFWSARKTRFPILISLVPPLSSPSFLKRRPSFSSSTSSFLTP